MANAKKVLSRDVSYPTQFLLWGKSAGRCEFAGCNRPLWKSSVTQEQVNIAQKAHIYSFSEGGPRGNEGIDKEKLNDCANLMLVCHECHTNMDNEKDGGRYSVQLLQSMKQQHEHRIELVTGIGPDKKSHVLLYGANVGEHSSPLRYEQTAHALFPERYPVEDKAIELGMVNSSFRDRSAEFWPIESANLEQQFNERVRPRLAGGDLRHLSVFGLAPQPLLMQLGCLLTDIPQAGVFQLHREPAGWEWPKDDSVIDFIREDPPSTDGPAALVFSLSATVTDDRIHAVLGADAKIWKLTVGSPHNDFVKSREQLAAFRQTVRTLLDQIKALHGQETPLHIFPAMPVSLAVELGRIRMPKADMPWIVYDQVAERGGFVRTFSFPQTFADGDATQLTTTNNSQMHGGLK